MLQWHGLESVSPRNFVYSLQNVHSFYLFAEKQKRCVQCTRCMRYDFIFYYDIERDGCTVFVGVSYRRNIVHIQSIDVLEAKIARLNGNDTQFKY